MDVRLFLGRMTGSRHAATGGDVEERRVRRNPFYRFLIAFLLLSYLMALQSCYHYNVRVPEPDPGTVPKTKTVHALLWGLVQPNTVADNCEESNTLNHVRATTNVGFALLTIITLGIYVPMQLEWTCGTVPPLRGETGEKVRTDGIGGQP